MTEAPEVEEQELPPFPPIPKDMLDELNKRFPERSPELEDNDRVIWYKAGARFVCNFLNEMYVRQNETVFDSE